MNCEHRLLPRVDPPTHFDVQDRPSPKHGRQKPAQATHSSRVGLRAVSLFEAAKGGIVLVAGLGAVELIGRDAQRSAEELVRQFHLNPAGRCPHIFQLLAQQATPAHLRVLAVAALAYAAVRFVEAYGLWRGRTWAEWFAVLSGSIYLPVEIWDLLHRVSWVNGTIFAVNLAIVCYLSRTLVHSRTPARSALLVVAWL